MSTLRQRFGRPLRLGIIGGGPESWIGRMHRGAAEFDGWWQVVCTTLPSEKVGEILPLAYRVLC